MSNPVRSAKEREKYWMNRWLDEGIFNAEPDPSKPKFFITFPFPYMNGSLHLGHAYTSTRLDVIARYKRLKGYNVLFPWAWHWTGEAVMGICHRIQDGDQEVIKRLIELDGVPREEIEKFKDPIYLVKFFTKRGKEDIKRIGHSIDWRREFHTSHLHPLFTKFIEWQIRKLYDNGYITKGPYPVVWCPRDESPTGDHDRLIGEGIRPEEYTIIKFKLIDEDLYLVAATFRPETIFGTTNVWLHPDLEYAIADVDGEKWLISEEAANKLTQQLKRINILKKVKGSNLIGRFVNVPLINRIVPILPAEFVDPSIATGVVYSVPAHAPYDWLALKELKDNVLSLDPALRNIVNTLYPISIIKVDGFGEYPAVEICEKMGITSQRDERAEEATHEIYVKEFHTGIMKDNCIGVPGMPVSEAKEVVKNMLINKGLGDSMYDLPEKVVCRCGTRCIVRIIKDQWSLKYSDENWKAKAKKAIEGMHFFPPELKSLMIHYIDWYHDWPCTRKTGLGTPFPYSREWIVETLTDSTIYMAFYVISKYYNKGSINPEQVDDLFFDYVLLGRGRESDLEKAGYNIGLLKEIRDEFLYWYPVDLRLSGKDLISNHLTFFIFHHVAIFPEKHWPRSIAANGFIQLEGEPMSKSTGNFISLRDIVDIYGADATRLTLALGADDMEDPNFKRSDVAWYKAKIEWIPQFIKNIKDMAVDKEPDHYERVIISKLYMKVKEIEESLEKLRVAAAGRAVFNDMPNLFKEYLNLTGKPSKRVVENFVDIWIRLLSLYIPFISEEIWNRVLKKEGYVSLSKWPSIDLSRVSETDLLIEKYAVSVLEDIKSILKVIKIEAKTVRVYIPQDWKWKIYHLISEYYSEKRKPNIAKIIDHITEQYKKVDKADVARTAKEIIKLWFSDYTSLRDIKKIISDSESEFKIFKSNVSEYIRRKLNLEVEVYTEKEAYPEDKYKATRSLPLKPAYVIT
jgi:leucyl-tRNA synthetase